VAAGDDLRDGSRRCDRRVEDRRHRVRALCLGSQGEGRPRDHPQGPLAADEQLGEVVAGDALDRAPPGGDDLAGCQDDLETANVVGRDAVLDAAQPAGVGRQVSPDRAELPTGRVRWIEEAVLRDRAGERGVHDTRLDHREAVGRVDLDDVIHPLEREDDAAVDRVGRAGQAAAGTLGDDRDPEAGRGAEGVLDVGTLASTNDRRRVTGRAEQRLVEPVRLHPVRVVDHDAVREPRTQLGSDVDHTCRLLRATGPASAAGPLSRAARVKVSGRGHQLVGFTGSRTQMSKNSPRS
jgi:hypothetical protein